MNIDSAISVSATGPPRVNEPDEQINRARKTVQDKPVAQGRNNQVQPEELLNQIKAITEDGLFGVRFEQDMDSNELIVKIVDRKTDEVIRQIPPEELLNLTKHLNELTGNIVDTVS